MTSGTNRSIVRRPQTGTDLPGLHPTLAAIYAARKVRSTQELDRTLACLAPPDQLLGIDTAARIVADAVASGRRILFVGDFDADGATSCALGVLALRSMGAADVGYLVPNRFEYGYGLTPEIVQVASEQKPDLIITVDNGIASVDGVAAARERGINVVITDHHLPGPVLPAAEAIVNPNQPGDPFPSKALAGVGVLFYLMIAVRSQLRERDWFHERRIEEPGLAELLDLVAVGTVADLVPLDHNNRILVAQGLARIRAGKCRAGIRALLEVANRYPAAVRASDLGYAIGPRLNAAGRLDDITIGIECLLAPDIDTARALALQLDALNRQRRAIEAQMQVQARELLAELHLDGQAPAAFCLYDPAWHQGVVGLLATRIREQTGRPVIALAPGEGGELKGSARSIPGLHIRDLLDLMATRRPDLLQKFGGHAMAAGLSLDHGRLDAFREEFIKTVVELRGTEYDDTVVHSDGELAEEDLGIEFAELIWASGPWGQGFPEPVFDGEFEVLEQRLVGDVHLKMRLRKRNGSKPIDAIAFNQAQRDYVPDAGQLVRAAYRLDVNHYQGTRTPQLIIEYLEAC